MKNFYIYRKQFPLILAYGVTIHKCQGLSLDCAIVDLSDKVFSPRMAYVAVSRVRMLQGLNLFAFDPKSIMVSTSCLNKINQLRAAYRPDLKPYPLPAPPKPAHKHKLTGSVQHDEPTPKKLCGANNKGTKENSGLVKVTQLSLTKLQQREKERSQPNQELNNLLRRHVVPVTLMLSFCSKNQTYLTSFIQWMSCGNATYVTLWAFGFIGQTK